MIRFTVNYVHPLISSPFLLHSGSLGVLEPSLSVLGERRGYTLDKLPVNLRAQSLKNWRKQPMFTASLQKVLFCSPFEKLCCSKGDKNNQGRTNTRLEGLSPTWERYRDLVTSQRAFFQNFLKAEQKEDGHSLLYDMGPIQRAGMQAGYEFSKFL